MMRRVGFTGTSHGMTAAQLEAVRSVLTEYIRLCVALEFHHGDCIGADDQACRIALELGGGYLIICHPPNIDAKRAYTPHDYVRTPKHYLERNKDIVSESDVLIAAPREFTEQRRGGTWFTVRRAREWKVPVVLITPDGKVSRS